MTKKPKRNPRAEAANCRLQELEARICRLELVTTCLVDPTVLAELKKVIQRRR